MVTCMQQVGSLDDLRDYVNEIFCTHYELKAGAFPMTERVLRRGGKPCGVFFCLHGPRAVKFTAIWEMERNQILFYDPSGERFQRTQLVKGPRLRLSAA